jgi:hypothetical protein
MEFYIRFVAQEVTAFAGAITRAVQLLAKRVDHLEQVTVIAAEHATSAAQARGPGIDLDPWVAVIVSALEATGGRVLHAECGSGAVVRALSDAGVDAYGVEPNETLALTAATAGLDVRADDAISHLQAVPDGALGALVLTGVVDRLALGGLLQLADLGAAKVAPGGRLIVVSTGPAAWTVARDPVLADLAPGRPLHPETWDHLLTGRGFEPARIDWSATDPERGLAPLPGTDVDAKIHNANIERLNQLLFSPPAYALVTRRSA